MVLAIGNDDDGASHMVLLGEALGGQVDGSSKVSALGLDEGWCGVLQEHLGRHVVAGDRQLHEGIAGKDDETYLVVGELVDQVLHQHLALVESRRRHILCQHRVGDVETDDGLNALTLVVRNLAAHLWTRHHEDEQGQGCKQQAELHRGAIR